MPTCGMRSERSTISWTRREDLGRGFGGAKAVAKARRRKFRRFDAFAGGNEVPIRPERIVAELQRVLPEDAIVVSDPGTSCPYLSAYYRQSTAGRRFITNRAHGALGFSLGAALGAWFGQPESKIVAIMGDGSFGFTVGELETVVRCKAPLTLLVLTNDSFGWIRASQHADCGARYHNVDFDRTDHAAVATDYGIKAWRVEDPRRLEAALREAVEWQGPTLVDVVCQPLEESGGTGASMDGVETVLQSKFALDDRPVTLAGRPD